MEFRELKGFTEIIEKIASDDELLSLQLELVENPMKGKLVQKTGGARKIRMAVRGRGKSGGARVIYYFQDRNDVIWMLTAYLKSEKNGFDAKRDSRHCRNHQRNQRRFIMKKTMPDQSEMANNWRKFKDGKLKLRTWTIDAKSKKRTMILKGIDDIRKERAEKLKEIRAGKLKVSQSEFAKALHVSVRTLQGWEIGKSLPPEPVMVLIELIHDMPEVRGRLLPKKATKAA
jgi:DNA-binding transcriptional regulator YiaG